MLHKITFCDTHTIDGLCSSLAKLGLHNFDNDNTSEHASVWQKLLTFLHIYNKIPVDATTILLDQYAKCSVAGFRQHFNTLVSIKHPLLESVSSILQEGQDTERQLKKEGQWNPTKKQGGVFLGADKDKKDDKQPHKDKDKDKDKTKKQPMHDRNGNPIDRHLPKSGEAHKHNNSLTGKEEHWCGNPKCQRWGSHGTQSHAEWFEKSQAKKKKGKEGKDDKKTNDKQGTTPLLQIPRANYGSTIGEGFDSPF